MEPIARLAFYTNLSAQIPKVMKYVMMIGNEAVVGTNDRRRKAALAAEAAASAEGTARPSHNLDLESLWKLLADNNRSRPQEEEQQEEHQQSSCLRQQEAVKKEDNTNGTSERLGHCTSRRASYISQKFFLKEKAENHDKRSR